MDELEKELYKKADEQALQLRLDYGYCDKKIDVFELCKKLNIKLVKYSSLNQVHKEYAINSSNDGLGIFTKRNKKIHEWSIYYNDEIKTERIRFTIGHEIGHGICEFYIPKELEEKVFDHFSRELLVPKCLLIKEGYENAFDISKDFEVSLMVANNALRAANNWKMNEFFKFKEQEIEFLKNFEY